MNSPSENDECVQDILFYDKEGRITRDLKQNPLDPKQLSPIALAFIGDGVFELLVRERLVQNGTLPAHLLHRQAVEKVNAAAQATAYEPLEAVLNGEEQHILKRGRNANSTRIPKSCSAEEYRKATAIEALFGYLYLKGEMDRLGELYRVVDGCLTSKE